MKRICLLLLLAALFVFAGNFSLYAADNVSGTWAMLNDETGMPDGYVLFHTHNGTLYGRIIALVDGDTGLVVDTLALEKERDQSLAGKPPLCGLDFIFNMREAGDKWEGRIYTPSNAERDGKFFKCTIKSDGDNLIVRASVFIFGEDIKFAPVTPEDIPEGVIVPDTANLVPNIPVK